MSVWYIGTEDKAALRTSVSVIGSTANYCITSRQLLVHGFRHNIIAGPGLAAFNELLEANSHVHIQQEDSRSIAVIIKSICTRKAG